MPTARSLTYDEAVYLASRPLDSVSPEAELSLEAFLSSLTYEEADAFMCESDFRRYINNVR